MKQGADGVLTPDPGIRSRGGPFGVGEYLCSERDLYRIEEIEGGDVLIEDCRTGVLIQASTRTLRRLKRVRASER